MDASEPLTLADGVIELRPWRPDDASAVHAACQDPLIARFVPIPQPYTLADADAFILRSQEAWATTDQRSFAIVDATTASLLGSIARHPSQGHRVEFGYWLAPAARGRGIATRALRLLVDWTLATTDAIRLEVWTDAENDASGAVALRTGFECEGLRRAWALDRNGRPIDGMFYVRVRTSGR